MGKKFKSFSLGSWLVTLFSHGKVWWDTKRTTNLKLGITPRFWASQPCELGKTLYANISLLCFKRRDWNLGLRLSNAGSGEKSSKLTGKWSKFKDNVVNFIKPCLLGLKAFHFFIWLFTSYFCIKISFLWRKNYFF